MIQVNEKRGDRSDTTVMMVPQNLNHSTVWVLHVNGCEEAGLWELLSPSSHTAVRRIIILFPLHTKQRRCSLLSRQYAPVFITVTSQDVLFLWLNNAGFVFEWLCVWVGASLVRCGVNVAATEPQWELCCPQIPTQKHRHTRAVMRRAVGGSIMDHWLNNGSEWVRVCLCAIVFLSVRACVFLLWVHFVGEQFFDFSIFCVPHF